MIVTFILGAAFVSREWSEFASMLASGGRAFLRFLDWQFTGANDELTNPSTVFDRPTAMRRYFPRLTAGYHELTMSLTDDLNIVDVQAGSAEPRLPEVPGEYMHLIEPLRAGRGYRLGMAYSVTDLRILTSTAG